MAQNRFLSNGNELDSKLYKNKLTKYLITIHVLFGMGKIEI